MKTTAFYSSGATGVRFSRWLFSVAGVYGLIVLLPFYFMEQRIAQDYPPPVTHPEYYYGFVGVALAWQIAFLIIARDPVRYRLMMIPGVLEKFGFALAALVLYQAGRVPGMILASGCVDAVWGVLFLVAFRRTRDS